MNLQLAEPRLRFLPLPSRYARHFDIARACYRCGSLTLHLRDYAEQDVLLRCENVLALRVYREEDTPLLSAKMADGPSGLASIDQSAWLEQLAVTGHQASVQHWVLAGANQVFEFVSADEPRTEGVPLGDADDADNSAAHALRRLDANQADRMMEGLSDEKRGLQIVTGSPNPNGHLFPEFVAYRVMQIDTAQKVDPKLRALKPGLSRIPDGQWLSEFLKLGGGLLTERDLQHWALVSLSEVFEVFALSDPSTDGRLWGSCVG